MVELKVGQVWRTDGDGLVVLMDDLWGTGVLPECECSGPGTHFRADNAMIYRQNLKDNNRYYTFSCMVEVPSDLVTLEAEAE